MAGQTTGSRGCKPVSHKPSAKNRAVRFFAITVAAGLLTACGPGGFKTHADRLSEKAEAYIAAHPELSEKTKQDIRLFRLHKGMSKQEVIAAWGRPIRIERFSPKEGEYWYFGCDWPHTCSSLDEDTDFPLLDEIYESQAQFKNGKLVYWRS